MMYQQGDLTASRQTLRFVSISLVVLSMSGPLTVVAAGDIEVAPSGIIKHIDDFSKNHGGWWERGFGDDVTAVINKGYTLNRLVPGGWWVFNSHSFVPEQWADFEISVTIRWVEGIENNGFGLNWGQGWTKFKGRNIFNISSDGHYTIREELPEKLNVVVKWTKSAVVKKGKAANRLTVQKKGNWVHYLINGQEVEKLHFRPFFGEAIGFGVIDKQKVIIENLQTTARDPSIPNCWIVENRGSLKSRYVWPDVRESSSFQARVKREADLRLLMASSDARTALVRGTVQGPSQHQGYSEAVCGLFIKTHDNAMLRLERLTLNNVPTIRFATYVGSVQQGEKKVVAPDGAVTLELSREGDVFSGRMTTNGVEKRIGSLKWPGLSPKVEAGLLTEYKNVSSDDPEELTIGITKFTIELDAKDAPEPVMQ